MSAIENQSAFTDMAGSDENVWIVDDFDPARKDLNVTPVPFNKAPTRKTSLNNLRITTFSQPDLHERYNSSEEEPSPSPDSGSQYDEDEDIGSARVESEKIQATEDGFDIDKENEAPVEAFFEEAKPEIAVAVPIMAIGRPKLIDITNIAPMHKRKRNNEYSLLVRTLSNNSVRRILTDVKESSPPTLSSASRTHADEEILRRRQGTSIQQPDSWLPDDDSTIPEEDEGAEDEDEYIPDLDLHKPLSYSDYDPYSLSPPKLSPRNSLSAPSKKPGSVARARNEANRPLIFDRRPSLRGLGRSFNLAKRQDTQSPPKQITKKPRMLPRGATERTENPLLPPFPAKGRQIAT
ncbi:uncharacterized protein KY384_005326 [Bacidia gigantensis]|uniref:uncharacterized protein n=1 Tax=Bacidia gigantensis TaxID=2732470 RepID=UPI001D0588DB|nr:uncharacterized protein KY384_005326 [Bacidia gigantensis]KAG8529845.1 hypothetical protein KY384_005326 [Bacidia gigantensis]